MGVTERNSCDEDSSPPAALPARGEIAASAAMMADVRSHGAVGAALRALFVPGGDAKRFGTFMRESVAMREDNLVAAAAKARLRLQDNAYELLSARDLLSNSLLTLGDASAKALQVSNEVSSANDSLTRMLAARKSLDATLEIVTRTRMLVRMYARAEDMAASRRLHAALRTLGRLDEAAAEARDEDVLRALIPPTHPLRADMVSHVRRALTSWLVALRSDMPLIGSFVTSYVRRRARGSSQTSAGGDVRGSGGVPMWIPAVYDDERGIRSGGPSTSSKWWKSAQSSGSTSGRHSQGVRRSSNMVVAKSGDSISGDADEKDIDWSNHSPPRISMRLLLTCVLTCRDLGTLVEFAEDYRRERAKQFEAGIDAILQEQTSADTEVLSAVERHARLISFILSFFTVERAVAKYSAIALIPPTLLSALWNSALEVVATTAPNAIDLNDETAKRLRMDSVVLRHFARIYGFDNSP